MGHQQRSEKTCEIWQGKCPKSTLRAKGSKQAVKVFSRVWAGQRGAARDVYSYGKGKHQAISKCGIYLQLYSCIHLHEFEVHPTDREPAASGALSRIIPWNCSQGTVEHQTKPPGRKLGVKFFSQQHRQDSPRPELNLGAEEPPHLPPKSQELCLKSSALIQLSSSPLLCLAVILYFYSGQDQRSDETSRCQHKSGRSFR